MSAEVLQPEIIVFAGPNGSGKSTITKLAKTVGVYINADDITMLRTARVMTCGMPSIPRRSMRNWAGCRRRSLQMGLRRQFGGIWNTGTGGRRSFPASTRSIMRRCMMDAKMKGILWSKMYFS